jgi:hypothetical protein
LSFSDEVKRQFADQALADRFLTASNINRNPEIIDRTQWIDIARIWFYELGSQAELGKRDIPLDFGIKAATTRLLRSHPSVATRLNFRI